MPYQQTLCQAIAGLNIVRLKYDDDWSDRTFAPHAVYQSSTGKTLVAGVQIDNPAEPWERLEPRNFDLSKIRSVTITGKTFSRHPRFNPLDKRYARGFICRVQ
ncbi:MAG: WYL domain-containing protein [Thalassobaculum sp.]